MADVYKPGWVLGRINKHNPYDGKTKNSSIEEVLEILKKDNFISIHIIDKYAPDYPILYDKEWFETDYKNPHNVNIEKINGDKYKIHPLIEDVEHRYGYEYDVIKDFIEKNIDDDSIYIEVEYKKEKKENIKGNYKDTCFYFMEQRNILEEIIKEYVPQDKWEEIKEKYKNKMVNYIMASLNIGPEKNTPELRNYIKENLKS